MAKNINFEERYAIECMLKSGYKLTEISCCIGRSYKTIKHEVNRCSIGITMPIQRNRIPRSK